MTFTKSRRSRHRLRGPVCWKRSKICVRSTNNKSEKVTSFSSDNYFTMSFQQLTQTPARTHAIFIVGSRQVHPRCAWVFGVPSCLTIEYFKKGGDRNFFGLLQNKPIRSGPGGPAPAAFIGPKRKHLSYFPKVPSFSLPSPPVAQRIHIGHVLRPLPVVKRGAYFADCSAITVYAVAASLINRPGSELRSRSLFRE